MGNQSLYDRIGGERAVHACVIKLYQAILSDEDLIPFFEGVSVERLRASQVAFISYALGHSEKYSGQTLRTAHARLVERGLDDYHFDRVKLHLSRALAELGVEKSLINEAMKIVETTRSDVLNR